MVARSKLGRWRVGYSGTSCPRCRGFLRHGDILTGTQRCKACGISFEAVRFDPVKITAELPAVVGAGPEASAPCARHARNQAVASCARCGQFMCSLCRIDADGKAYCPPCFDRLSAEGTMPGGALRVKNFSGLASACLVTSWLVIFVAPISSSVGIYFCVKGLKEKRSRNEADGIARLYFLMILNLLVVLGSLSMVALIFGAFAASGRH